MESVLFISLVVNAVLALMVVFFSFKDEHKKAQLIKERRRLTQSLYEVSILNQVSDKIGSAQDIPSIAQTIAITIEQLMEVTTVSYATIESNQVFAKTYARDNISTTYLQAVEEAMKASIHGLDTGSEFFRFKHDVTRGDIKSYNAIRIDAGYGSLFHIPLVFNNQFCGVITVTHKKREKYTREDMDILYKIVRQIEHSIERLEQVVTREKGKLDALVVSLPSGAILFSLENGYLNLSTINHAACDFLKVDQKDATATQVLAKLNTTGFDFVKQIKDVMRQKTSLLVNEVELNKRYFKIYLNPVFAHGGDTIIGVNVTLQDITREKEIDKIKKTFTSMIVHELRAPLVSMRGAAQLLLRPDLKEDDRARMLSSIQNSSERMLGEVSDLLDSAKLEEGRFDIVKSEGDINKLIQERATTFAYQASAKMVSLTTDLDPSIPQFEFDPDRIAQVVTNLISNSLKFTPSKGSVTVKSRLKGGNVCVSVTDTGAGIPEGQKGLLFSKYGQLASAVKSKGTGLGLFISKGIIDAHHGKIAVDSEVGYGTTVWFEIPIHDTESGEKSAPKKEHTETKIPEAQMRQRMVN